MRHVLIIGATSAIAHATATHFAADRDRLFLVARDPGKLRTIAADLEVRGASQVDTFLLDMDDVERHQEMLDAAMTALGKLDVVLVAYGTLPEQKALETSVDQTVAALHTNAVSSIAFLTRVANLLEEQGDGTLAVISSVAGDRGRQSNYVYGAAKAALSTFLGGLRGRLYRSGVAVVTIKPGLIDTPMTAGIKKGPLFASADRAGKDIYRAIIKPKDVVYVPWFWQGIMSVIKLIPERFFKRMNLEA